jgi:hypothetical protein
MWSDVIPVLNLALIWLIVLVFAFTLLDQNRVSSRLAHLKHPLLFLLLVALIARLLPVLLLPVGAGYDIDSFRLVGDAFLNGEEVYTSAAKGRHPYLPLHLYLIGLTTYLSRLTPLPFVTWVKIPAVIADLLITAVVYKVFRRWEESEPVAAYWALLYALNPISVLVSAYHGQFDSIPVLLLLLSWFTWHFGRYVSRSAVFLGFSILYKTWPVLFLPVIFIRLPDNRRRLVYILISIGIPVLFTTAYVIIMDSNPVPMLRRALTHAGVPGYWGLSALLYVPGGFWINSERIVAAILPFQRILLLLAGLFSLWWTRRQSALDALLTIMLSIFSVTLGLGIQWLLWPVAFAIVAREKRWLKWYTLMSTLMLFVHLYGLHLYPWARQIFEPPAADALIRISFLPAWVVVLSWTFSRLRRAKNLTTLPST